MGRLCHVLLGRSAPAGATHSRRLHWPRPPHTCSTHAGAPTVACCRPATLGCPFWRVAADVRWTACGSPAALRHPAALRPRLTRPRIYRYREALENTVIIFHATNHNHACADHRTVQSAWARYTVQSSFINNTVCRNQLGCSNLLVVLP